MIYVLVVALAAFGAVEEDGYVIGFSAVIALLQITDAICAMDKQP